MVKICIEHIYDLLTDYSLFTKYPFTELFLTLRQISWIYLRYFKEKSDIITPLTVHMLEIRRCMSGNGQILINASIHPLNCATHVIELTKLGDLSCVVGWTTMNNRSSRSHKWGLTVFKLSLLNFHSDNRNGVIKIVNCKYIYTKYMQCWLYTCMVKIHQET